MTVPYRLARGDLPYLEGMDAAGVAVFIAERGKGEDVVLAREFAWMDMARRGVWGQAREDVPACDGPVASEGGA